MKRHLMVRETQKFLGIIPSVRTIKSTDGEFLGALMYSAYQGAIDYEGETLEQSIQEMKETLNGKYGAVIWDASFMTESSAVVFVNFEKEKMPLLAFAMTHPDHRGQGLSQKLIKLSLTKLSELNHTECCLVVTEGNQPAQSIYEKLGFKYKS